MNDTKQLPLGDIYKVLLDNGAGREHEIGEADFIGMAPTPVGLVFYAKGPNGGTVEWIGYKARIFRKEPSAIARPDGILPPSLRPV